MTAPSNKPRDLVLAVVYAIAIVLLFFLSGGSSGVFVYQGF